MRKIVVGIVALACSAVPSLAAVPSNLPDGILPVLHSATPPGVWHAAPAAPAAPSTHAADGDLADWTGEATGFAGTAVYSHGEYVYTDHLFDAYGADDGGDADRLAKTGPVMDAVPQTYRVEAALQADIPGELGAPNPIPVAEQYGDAGLQPKADLTEVRVAADASTVYVLARTAAMTSVTDTAILLLADTTPGAVARSAGFNSGVTSAIADEAVLLSGDGGVAESLATHAQTPVTSVADPDGYVNAIEAAIPRPLLERPDGTLSLAIAAGLYDPSARAMRSLASGGVNVANVAFRFDEPVRVWFDEQQALALHQSSVDPFFTTIDLGALAGGETQTFTPDGGYFERVFRSSPAISTEGGTEGELQHYGVYLPPGYGASSSPVPMTMWFHWRGGKAHSAATMTPRLMRDMGDGLGGIVVSPRGRGTSSWYLGKGMVDANEVYDDATATFRVDADRVYVSGHSMGGWASYLMPILYPDRFAASFPVSPPVTQGAWTGLDFPGCDGYRYDEYTFCYEYANDSNPRVQHTRRLLANLRNVPIAIYAGGADELVPISGEILQAESLAQLGYRYRLYDFPTYEHYTPPVVDEWMEGVRYFAAARRDPNPARVSYIRDMPFERSVEVGPSQTPPYSQSNLGFDFDRAYWMSGLTPADASNGVAHFEGRTLAKPDPSTLPVPEAGGPSGIGQTGPFAMTGLAWADDPLASFAPANAFDATLTGATSVTLDLARMALDVTKPVTATVSVDRGVALRLAGSWPAVPVVTVNGVATAVTYASGVLTIPLAAGASTLTIG